MPSVYHDRKMLKWLPFEALEAQGEYMRELHESLRKEPRPVLSEDQHTLMQYTLEEAIVEKKEVIVDYFESGTRHQCEGFIQGSDATLGILFVGSISLTINNIINITLK